LWSFCPARGNFHGPLGIWGGMSITARLLADRFERTASMAAAIIDAERQARDAKTARLRALRLAREETQSKGKRKARAKPAK
jgi:hypothetical protein